MRYIIILLFLITLTSVTTFTGYARCFKMDVLAFKADSDTIAVKKQSVSAGITYGSDASFFGRTNKIKYPFITTDVIFNTKSGVFVYGSAWKVLGSMPTIDEFDLGVGYSYKLSKSIKGTFSYTRFIFNNQAQIIKSASSNDFNLKTTFDWKILKSGVTFDYLFGKTNDFFVTISHSHYFESNFSVFDDKDYLTFTPAFNVILGTQNFVQRFSSDHDFFKDIDPSHNNSPTPPPPPNEDDYRKANRNFNVLNYNIKIPLAYNRPHYTIEASYKYSIPVNVQGLLATKNQSFFNLTFYYVFY
ncbi:hypothetical protein [Mucilaginibacter paludis]|uniref:Uncharacterized protein n=1 Tax=Mucilaginibacter paludis DSM 18603 TaxID=714943 RepID=H1Y490_9SPHI|nr:hypothetical protein [Mucilaginibacter paludis]EHQ25724.1 hypothetical protein Mucpa_1566 [Mucilaginibacter paludis DSM 18603]